MGMAVANLMRVEVEPGSTLNQRFTCSDYHLFNIHSFLAVATLVAKTRKGSKTARKNTESVNQGFSE